MCVLVCIYGHTSIQGADGSSSSAVISSSYNDDNYYKE